MKTCDSIFQRYEQVKSRFPSLKAERGFSIQVENLGNIEEDFDLFLFDAFGVLNVGETVIDGAPERIRSLQDQGKHIYFLTNAASYQKPLLVQKFKRLGFNIGPQNIVSSREVLIDYLQRNLIFPKQIIKKWGAISVCNMGDFPRDLDFAIYDSSTSDKDDDAFWAADAYMFLSSANWTFSDQKKLIAHLQKTPKPIVVGNPDLVAPRETAVSLEPGYFVHEILDKTDAPVEFYGKPYENAFQTALKRAKNVDPTISLARTIMLGDTLHTDILGGMAAGIRTGLVTKYGTYAGQDVTPYIQASNITPTYIMPTI